MKQKKNFKGLIFVCFLSISFLCAIFLSLNLLNNSTIANVSAQSNTIVNSSTQEGYSLHSKPSTAGDSSLNYQRFEKGQTVVNIVFNFVNYKNDNINNFTPTEIQDIVSKCETDINEYFERMSQGVLTLNIDYVVSTASESYSYYKSLPEANSLIELSLIASSITNKKNEYGNTKNLEFNTASVGVNFFAGSAGGWSTFLWPHAYDGGLILLMEHGPEHSVTLCHELLHVFGVGDLYAYTGDSQYFSAQHLDMMSTSTENMSTNAYFRNKIGWLDSSEYGDATDSDIETFSVNSKKSKTVDLYASCTTNYNKTIAYKFGENEDKNEFFMVEYKIKGYGPENFDAGVPETGVVIYRVNTTVDGNSQGNENAYNEVIYMGDISNSSNISTDYYTTTCLLKEGDTYGNRGAKTNKSLVYSGGAGRTNLFTGENSEISIKVEDLTSEYATITITFKEDLEVIDLTDVNWNYENPLTYNGEMQTVELINIPSELTVTYTNIKTAKNAGTYTVTAVLNYDDEVYVLRNQNFSLTLTWKILPAQITYTINNKTSKYGEALQPLTCSISQGQLYGSDSLNITLLKEEGVSAGSYDIDGEVESNPNYNVVFVKGIYTITKRNVNIKVLNQEYFLSSFVSADYTKYEVLEGDSILTSDNDVVILVVKEFISAEIGTYEITAITFNESYNLGVTPGTLTILEDLPVEDPVIPEEPTEPEEPIIPEEPTEPEEPIIPEDPVAPEEPVEPEFPVVPEEPSKPEEPLNPDTPNNPTYNQQPDNSEDETKQANDTEANNQKQKIILYSVIGGISGLSVIGVVSYIIKLKKKRKQQSLWDENLLK